MTGDLAAPVAAVDDPEWVLAMYREAKALITDLREESLPAEWRERVEDFCIKTAMDTCTTFGPDCRCNQDLVEGPTVKDGAR